MTENTDKLSQVLAPAGRLRAAINFSNTVLAQRDEATGAARGVSVDLARDLAKGLSVPAEFIPFSSAAAAFAAVATFQVDVGFFAIDTERAKRVDFSPPYVLIEGTYLARRDGFRAIGEADADGKRIAVVRGSAYALHLSHGLRHAGLVVCRTESEAFEALRDGKADLVAGVREMLQVLADGKDAYSVLPGHFMIIRQALCIPKGRDVGLNFVGEFIEERKASGMIADALRRSGQAASLAAPCR